MTAAAFTFAPLAPPAVLAAGAALTAILLAFGLWRGTRGTWLRPLAPAILLLALTNPRWVSEDRRPLSDIAVVLIDDSPSQHLADRPAQTERILTDVRKKLARLPLLDVREERVAGGLSDGTRLFSALERALADIPRNRLAGVIAITDGQIHDIPADVAAAVPAPFHALITGALKEHDRRVSVQHQPGYAMVGRSAAITVRIEDNESGDKDVALSLRIDGTTRGSVIAPLNRDTTINVPIDHAGPQVIELATPVIPDELSAANNRVAVTVNGIRDRLRVLLISGEPHAGERAWRNLLKADPSVDLVHFTILRPPEKDDRTPIRELALIAFPVRELFEDKLSDFDLVILDRYRHRSVLSPAYYRNLADYVRRGGALLAAVGPEYAEADGLAETAVAEVLPALPTGRVDDKQFHPRLTDAGRRHPVTADLANAAPQWGPWVRRIEVGSVAGTALLADDRGAPLVVLNRVGQGRVALILSDTLWLWARGVEGGGPHDELLRRLAHWLMREPALEEESLSAQAKGDILSIERRSLDHPPATIQITAPDGARSTVPLRDMKTGKAVAETPADQPGLWRIEDGTFSTVVAVGGVTPLELGEVVATPAKLTPVAKTTGGSVHVMAREPVPDIRKVSPASPANGTGWIGVQARDEHQIAAVHETALLPSWLVMLLGLAALAMAWWREGRGE